MYLQTYVLQSLLFLELTNRKNDLQLASKVNVMSPSLNR